MNRLLNCVRCFTVITIFMLIAVPLLAEQITAEKIHYAAYVSSESLSGVKRSLKTGEVIEQGVVIELSRGNYILLKAGADRIRIDGPARFSRASERLFDFDLSGGGVIYGMMPDGELGSVQLSTSYAAARVNTGFFLISRENKALVATVFEGGLSLSTVEGGGITGANFLRQAEAGQVFPEQNRMQESYLASPSSFSIFNKVLEESGSSQRFDFQTSVESLFRDISVAERRRLVRRSPGVAGELNMAGLRLIGADTNVDLLADEADNYSEDSYDRGSIVF